MCIRDSSEASEIKSSEFSPPNSLPIEVGTEEAIAISVESLWAADAEKELGKIPFFVRGKARRNTEKFAVEHGISRITIETLYDAKAHYGR